MMLWRNPHRRFRERLSTYLDGELSPDEALAVEAHIESCGSCAEELAEIRLASAVLAELPELEAPRSFRLTPEDVARQARAPQAVRSINSGLRLTGGALAAVLAVLLVLDMGGVVGNGGRTGDGTESQREAAFGISAGVTDSAGTPLPGAEAPEADGVQGGGMSAPSPEPEAGPLPTDNAGRDEYLPQATTTPAPTRTPGGDAAALGLNGHEEEDTETFQPEDTTTDADDGLSALTVAEIVLAALLGASLIGIGAATYAGRRRG